MAWLKQAAKLPGKAINLGIAIWWLHGMSSNKAFKLTGKALEQLGISRDAAYSALKRLEAQVKPQFQQNAVLYPCQRGCTG